MAGQRGGFFGYFTRHRTAANLILVLMIAAGIAAFPNMRAQYFPDIVSDEVDVNVTWTGAGAEDVDRAIVALLEPALLAIEGVAESESRASEGRARIELEFEPGWDMSRATDDVQQAVDGVTNLPDDADEPTVSRSAWRDRVTDTIITGPIGVEQLGRIADTLITRLFAEGVTRTSIRGIAAPNTLIEVQTASLIRNDVTMQEIGAAIAAEADASPAGDVAGANARIRTGTAKRTPEAIAGIVLRSNTDGSQLTIGDVATISVEGAARDIGYFVGDNPALSVSVARSATGDAIGIQRTVEEVAAELETTLPRGVSIDLIRTRSEQISSRLDILLENGLTGLALVVGLLFLFLNARTAIWVAAGIPVAMCAAIFLMYTAGLTLNMISLFALILTLGIVVDDAIVVGEHADFRARTLGEPPDVAAATAASRMAGPVFSATVTTIIAFMGLTAIGGRFGEMIADIPYTVIVVLIASLVECFVILPNHMAHSVGGPDRWYDWPSRQVNRGFDWVKERAFRPVMRFVLWARYPVLAALVVLLALQMSQLVAGSVQWRFFSAPEEGSVDGNFAMAPGATREESLDQMRAIQAAVEAVGAGYEEEFGTNPVDYAIAQIGGNTGRGLASTETKESYQLGSIAVELIDADARPYSSFEFVGRLQDAVERHPMLETISFRGNYGGPGGDSLDVQFYGAETATLKAAAERLKEEAGAFPEVSGLEDTLSYDKEEQILDLTPQGAALGFTIDGLGLALRNRLNGIEAATYPDGNRSATIRVELPEDELTADFLDRTLLRTPEGAYVPLADIVNVERQSGFSSIRRENGLRVVSVYGEIADDDPAAAAEVTRALQEDILPRIESEFGVGWNLSGLAEQERSFLADAAFGFGLCLLGIFLTLAWVFSSWTRPLLIMAVIPFGLIGAIYGHAAWGIPMSMFTVVGLIGMSGIIINDSIVLVTTVDEYSAERGLRPAIVDGAVDRLRPVMLTTLTTVFGLMPLLYEPSSQAQFLKPTVVTLVYGLGFGVILVLIAVPAMLAVQHDLRRQQVALRRAVGRPGRGRSVTAAVALAGLGTLALFAATLGHALVLSGIWPPLATAAGMEGAGSGAALGLFIAGTFGIVIAAYLIAMAAIAIAGRRRLAA
ncbi:efflux RND transporter permease subunit [Roseicyclus sp. F158]|uniref:Efflux RND transporter permease subunit n=1 Tax=Tropicimonas omnivorans TaxID=3075590 RepID=A0ABU3DC68_9RHOB|nr:efflux RND transporter permease subunit [Roseicyclus sp. F158]MDT0681311.1 efflux RND transporter permease subunit [Roseicyclus sp. F158]